MKKRKYKDYDLTEFLVDEEFRLWVLNPDENQNIFWNRWILSNPEKKPVVLKARELILSMKFDTTIVSEKDKNESLDLILQGNLSKGHLLPKNRDFKKRSHAIWFKTAVAAAVSIITFSSVLYLLDNELAEPQVQAINSSQVVVKKALPGSKITTKLPDGSLVTLNSGSTITFPDNFSSDTREVKLVGEAFFDVEHNPDKPFFVSMNGDQVRVLGTSFNIRSYPDDSTVYVSVASGRVAYSVPSGEEVILEHNQMATHHLTEGSLTTGDFDRLQSFGWKDRIIYFNSKTLDDIIIELERWYGVEIKVLGGFEPGGKFSGQFHDLSLEEVLTGLSYEFKFSFKIENKNITLKSNHNLK